MKKIFVSLFACVLFLFSCNLNMSSGDTDLIVYLPGSEGKVTQYRAENVKTYRIDLTNENGDYYSQTGEPGGTIVFNNILCGTYTVDIWALDESTFVAAHTSTTITVFKGEENYLSATAILRNKVSDFFVSVPKGVWNLDHARYFREKNYYNAVRDVEYGAYEEGQTEVTYAKIINPDVEYAYLNYATGYSTEVSSSEVCNFKCDIKTEKKSTIFVTVYDSLREEYGYTRDYEYDPENNYTGGSRNNYDGSYTVTVSVPNRDYNWHPFVKIAFSKDCGKIFIKNSEIQKMTPAGSKDFSYWSTSIPFEKQLVKVTRNLSGAIFIFDKSKSGSQYAAALIPGMQIQEYDCGIEITIRGLTVNKDVKNLSIKAGSYAADEKIYTSELKNFSLEKSEEDGDENSYDFHLIVPKAFVYNEDFEGVFIEIHPEGFDGDTLEMNVNNVTTYNYNQGLYYAKCLFTEFYNLKDINVPKAPVMVSESKYSTVLMPGETKTFGASIYSDLDYYLQENCLYEQNVLTGQIFKGVLGDQIFVPLVMHEGENNVSGLSFYKTSDGKFYIKNNTSYDMPIDISFGDCGDISIEEPRKTISFNYKYDYRSVDQILHDGNHKKVKIASIDASRIMDQNRVNKFKDLKLTGIKCIPVSGTVDFINNNNQQFDGATFEVVVKDKKGNVLKNKTIEDIEIKKNQFAQYAHLQENFKQVKQNAEVEIEGTYNTSDTVVDIYLVYPSSITGNFISVYEVNVYWDCVSSN